YGDLSDNEIKNLVRVCDVFVSLHRSEGFGRGMAEAMAMGRPAIATGYSGNLDFMTWETGLLVDYQLAPVPPAPWAAARGLISASAFPPAPSAAAMPSGWRRSGARSAFGKAGRGRRKA